MDELDMKYNKIDNSSRTEALKNKNTRNELIGWLNDDYVYDRVNEEFNQINLCCLEIWALPFWASIKKVVMHTLEYIWVNEKIKTERYFRGSWD